jgi:hypothetical protein
LGANPTNPPPDPTSRLLAELERVLAGLGAKTGGHRPELRQLAALVERLRASIDQARSITRVTTTVGWTAANARRLERLVERIGELTERVEAHDAAAARQADQLTTLARSLAASARADERPNQRSWYRSPRVVAVVVICCLVPLAAGIWLGIDQLNVDQPPLISPPSIALAPPIPATNSQGFATAVTVAVHGCANPVDVNVQFAGSIEYWVHSEHVLSHGVPAPGVALKQPLPIAVTVEGPPVQNLRLSIPAIVTPHPLAVMHPVSVRVVPPGGTVSGAPVYLAAGLVDQWDYSHSVVVASFKADWVYPRGSGSCYVLIPALVSPTTDCATGVAEATFQSGVSSHPDQSTWEHDCTDNDQTESVNIGSNAVQGYGDSVNPANSLPPPTRTADSVWTCQEVPQPAIVPIFPAEPKLGLQPVIVPSMAELRRYDNANADCSAIVELSSPNSATTSQLLLLLAGALIAVGAATAFDVARRALVAPD